MYRWDLSPLYPDFKDASFQEDCKKVFELTEALVSYFENKEAKENQVEYLENLLKKQEEISALTSRIFGFIRLNLSADTQNSEAKQELVKMQALSAKFALIDNKFKTHLQNLENLEELLEKSAYLKEYQFLLEETKEELEHTRSAELEVLTSELTQNGSSLWSQLQDI